MLKGLFGLALLLLTCLLGYKMSETEDSEQQISYKHIGVGVMACLHALSMLVQGQSKLNDAESIYMRYLYDVHKRDLKADPSFDPKNVTSEEEQSEGEHREVKFI